MEALKREATVERGRVVLEDLPIADGQRVEVILLLERQPVGREADAGPIQGLRAGRGGAKGLIFMSEDFDAPLPGLADYQP
jgi:hypothetical protein